ncbi:MAG: hypothetical protein C0597_10250 [Marinilabiliales bacterium]|nr:MAG: hypothetical protein C0597_10250 [Marinilabiliales bacterium]
MKKIKRYFFIIPILFILFIAGQYYFFNHSYVPQKSSFPIKIEEIRDLCKYDTLLPTHINAIITGTGELIPWTIAAGEKNIPNQSVLTSFQIVYANRTVVVDAPMNEKLFKKYRYGKEFLKENFYLQQKAMQNADLIIFTHEHIDHMGGIVNLPNVEALSGNILLTRNQIKSSKIEDVGINEQFLRKLETLDYKNFFMITPGIVLIEAPGHSKAHQMIFVKLQNGTEYLLAGDAVWNYANIEKAKNRPLFATMFGGENRRQLGHLIRWLHDLDKNEDIHIIPSHDPNVIKHYMKQNLLGKTLIN